MAVPDGRHVHRFEVGAHWSADERRGELRVGGPQAVTITVPSAFGGGPRPGTNPEELLLASALSCFLMTLARVMARHKLSGARIDASIVGEVASKAEVGLRFERIVLRPVVRGLSAAPERRRAMEDALLEAEQECFIARTLRPVIPYAMEPHFVD